MTPWEWLLLGVTALIVAVYVVPAVWLIVTIERDLARQRIEWERERVDHERQRLERKWL